jgi:hypothetical protein
MDAVGRPARSTGYLLVSTQTGEWAPVAIFLYKRPEHARRAIASLLACDGAQSSPIYVFADGPRTDAERPAVHATRAVARELLGDRAVFVERERNRGLANSIIAGATELCDRYGAVIVVEDDLLLAVSFLRFLNEGLSHYRDEPRVMQISGHIFDVPSLIRQREALLLPMTTSWGWATWKRAWDLFDPAATGWRERLADDSEAKRYNLGGNYDYLRMLKRTMSGQIDSWAIRWYYSVFACDGLAVFPPRTLVTNVGFDGSGTHDRLALPAHQGLLETAVSFNFPADITESRQKEQVYEAVRAFRPSSRPQKAMAYAKAALRRVDLR